MPKNCYKWTHKKTFLLSKDINLEKPYAIIAFGYPNENEKLFRNNDDIDRKRIKQVCKKLNKFSLLNKNLEKIIESVRYAPSMKNSQPWILYNNSNMIHLYEEKQKKNLRDTNKISMGIALRHLDVACNKFGVEVDYSKVTNQRLKEFWYLQNEEKAKEKIHQQNSALGCTAYPASYCSRNCQGSESGSRNAEYSRNKQGDFF